MNNSTTTSNFAPSEPLWHSAFYKFAQLDDPDAVADRLRELTVPLTGSVLVATEGINGMVAGSTALLDAFEHALQHDIAFGGKFAGIVFKRSECKTVPFRKMKVRRKNEIVPLGIAGIDGAKTGIDVPPAEWRELIKQDDVVLLDNRNSFEFKLGRFHNAIDPNVVNFRDFPKYVEDHLDEWKAEGKRVAMYCTGGIRCEKTSAWMKTLGMDVYQLQGGILNYFKEMPDAEKDWDGECFVFDNRIALDTHLHETDTTLEDVYGGEADSEWRLARAKRLNDAG
ncbi:MAG: hypothetical protein JNN20_15350 [Betaproteobacteria bacterium]|nr:hypothetical protein [Betaproteobacteria bacterium]